MDQPWSGPDRLEPARPYSIRPDSPLHQQDGGLAAPRFLLLSTSDQATVRRNGHCHLQLLSGFACCHASLFQLVDACCARATSPPASSSTIFLAAVLGTAPSAPRSIRCASIRTDWFRCPVFRSLYR